jgi:pimeloyl-ACP methyl ester carboxylesterase
VSNIEVAESQHAATTDDGWELELCCVRGDVRRRHPILVVPGYAMNSSVLEYQANGRSLVAALVEAGYEVWSVNLRGAGLSRPLTTSAGPVSLATYVDQDLPAALELVRSETAVESRAPFCIGTSLGGAIVYGHLARVGEDGLAGIVALGAPLRWDAVNPLLRTAFWSRRLARIVPMRGVRRVARFVMSPLARAGLLSAYVNRKRLDLNRTDAMSATVEDPTPELNAEIAEWMRARDLYLGTTNVTHALRKVQLPLLLVFANRDGLVPTAAARSAAAAWGGGDVEVVEVGTDEDWFAHADLFAARDALARVFMPIVRWLDARDVPPPATDEARSATSLGSS